MSGYSDAEIDAIKGWLVDGRSAGDIAALFVAQFRRHVSRNAIIGIVHRNKALSAIGLPGRKPAAPGERRAPLRKPSKPFNPAMPAPLGNSHFGYLPRRDLVSDIGEVFAPDPEAMKLHVARPPKVRACVADPAGYDRDSVRLPLLKLRRGQCRFPVNDAAPGEEHLFCGHRAQPGKSYCLHHLARAAGQGTVSERNAADFAASRASGASPLRSGSRLRACGDAAGAGETSPGLRSQPRPSAVYALKLGRA